MRSVWNCSATWRRGSAAHLAARLLRTPQAVIVATPFEEFSMAALQGYLLTHKNQPHRAVECAGKWVEGEMAKRESRKSSVGKNQ